MPVLNSDSSTILNRERLGPSNAPARKQPPLQILLLVAVVLLLVMGAIRIVGSANSKPAVDTVRVVAAAEDLPPGCRLGFTNLHYMDVPKKYFQPKMFTSYEQVAGSTTKFFLKKGEPISQSDMFPLKQSLSGVIAPSVRALTLKMDADALVDHAIQNGDRVDIIATVLKTNKKYTRTVAQNVVVLLATPREMMLSDKFRGNDNSKVTVAVSPEDCERVTEALESGRLRLALRNPSDQKIHALTGASDQDILPWDALKPETKPVAPAAPAIARVPMPPVFMQPPPPPPPLVPIDQAPPIDPVKWVVEVFQGSKKESCEVPGR